MNRADFRLITLSVLLALLGPAAVLAGDYEKAAAPQVRQVSEGRLRDSFVGYLHSHLRKPASDVIVSKFKVSGNDDVPAGPLSIQVFQKERGALVGHVRLAAILAVGGVPRAEVSMSGWVDVFESAVCISRPVKKGEILEREDLYLIRINTSRLQGSAMNDVEQAVGLMAKHNLRENTCLKEWMIEKPPVLYKGDMVTIFAQSGGLRVTVKGVVLERGYPGETVKVQNLMSQKTILARVIDASNVMVAF
jgi:flagellar basal body P-ring formation protein FlgA